MCQGRGVTQWWNTDLEREGPGSGPTEREKEGQGGRRGAGGDRESILVLCDE